MKAYQKILVEDVYKEALFETENVDKATQLAQKRLTEISAYMAHVNYIYYGDKKTSIEESNEAQNKVLKKQIEYLNKMKQQTDYTTVQHPYATALKWIDKGLKDLRISERHVKITTVEVDNEENIEAFKLIRNQRTELMRAKEILSKHLEL